MLDKNEDKKIMWLGIILVTIAIIMRLFRMDDSYIVILPCLLFITIWQNRKFQYTPIDIILMCITIYDIIGYSLHPTSGIKGTSTSVIAFFCYWLLRQSFCMKGGVELFLKCIFYPIIIALILALVSFMIFLNSVYNAGFIEIYSFRFLFTPLGYITNVWSCVCIAFLGVLSIGLLHISRWRVAFCLAIGIASVAILISFSRGAFIAWGIYILIVLISSCATKSKLILLITSFCLLGSVWFFFPKETSTTLAMNQTVTQKQSTESRIKAIEKSFRICQNHLYIGTGYGSYSRTMDKLLGQDSTGTFTSYAPNILIQLLIEKGIVGLILYGTLAIAVLQAWIKGRKKNITWLICGCLLAICIKESTMSTLLMEPILYFLFYILLALLHLNGTTKHSIKTLAHEKYAILLLSFASYAILEVSILWKEYNAKKTKQGIEAYNSGIYNKSISLFKDTPELIPFHVNRGMLAFSIPNDSLSATYLEKTEFTLDRDAQPDVFILYLKAKLLRQNRRAEEALALLQTLTKTYPRNSLYLYELASLLIDEGKKTESIPLLSKALWLSPRLLHSSYINNLFSKDSIFKKKVIENVTLQVAEKENTPNAYARYGYFAYYTNQKQRASTALQKAVALQPGLFTPWMLLGYLHEEEGNGEEAEVCFRRYNLLSKGAFKNDNRALHKMKRNSSESKLLFSGYAMKFKSWYGYELLY